MKAIRINLLLTMALMMLGACSSSSSEEEQLLQTLDAFMTAIEDRQRSTVLDFLHPDFKAQGQLSVREANQLMLYHFRQNKTIRTFVRDKQFNMNLPTADITANILVIGTSRVLPERGQNYQVKMRWQYHDSRWQLMRANWQVE